jgi:hypothetical protein
VALKETLHGLLAQGALEEVAELAERRHRALGSLVSLTFDPDPLIVWRSIEAMGLACDRIADEDPDCVRQHVRRLYWLITEESGGICWRAPEAMGEVIHRRPQLLADFLAICVYLLREMAEEDLEHFRAGVLWAIGRLGQACSDHLPDLIGDIVAALENGNPQVRGMAVWCLGAVGQGKRVTSRRDLLSDEGPVVLYENRELVHTSVSSLAGRIAAEASG